MSIGTALKTDGARTAPLRVLMVEDDANDAELLQAHLAAARLGGAQVMHARTLAEGLALQQSHDVQITLLDLDLPDSNGLHTLERMRAAASGPVIVISGNGHPSLVDEALKRRAYDVIPKDELDAPTLQRVLRLAALHQQAGREQGASEGRYRALLESTSEALVLLDANGRIQYASAAMRRVLGYNSDEILGRPGLGFVHPKDRKKAQKAFADLRAASGSFVTLRVRFQHKSGATRVLESSLANRLGDADVTAIVCSYRDVTLEQEQRERFSATFENAPVGLAHVDPEGCFQLVNRRLCVMLGYTSEELIGRKVRGLLHPEDIDSTAELRAQLHAGVIPQFTTRKRYLRKDGTTLWVQLTVSLERDAQGRPSYDVAAFEDVTDAVRAEERLRASESRLRAIVGAEPECVKLIDGEGMLLEMNPAGLAMIEAESLHVVAGQCVYALVAPAYRQRFKDLTDRVCRGERGSLEFEIVGLKGTRRWLETHAVPLRDEATGQNLLLGITRDITASKVAQLAAERLRRMYAALSSANEAIFKIKDEQELFRRICELLVEHGGLKLAAVRLVDRATGWIEAAAYAGGPARYLEKARVSIDRARPESKGPAATTVLEDRPMVINDYLADPSLALWYEAARDSGIAALMSVPLHRGGAVIGLTTLYAAESGWFDAELVGLAERMAQNLSFALDNIDHERQRNAAEGAVRASEQRFRSLTELSSDWFWEQDAELRFTRFVGGQGDEKWGGDQSLGIGLRRWELQRLTPLSSSWKEHRAALGARKPFRDFEYSRIAEDGGRRYVSASGTPVFGAAGEFLGYHGTAKDITERKSAEAALRESEARFRSLTALSSDWYWEQDAAFRFTVLSGRGADELANGGIANYLGKTRWDTPDLEPVDGTWDAHRALLERHEPFHDLVLRRKRGEGGDGYMSVSGEPVFDAAGVFAGYRGVARNVTEKMRAEADLRRFRAALDISVDSISLVDADSMRIIDLNDAALRMLGYERHELLGQPVSTVLPDRSLEDMRAAYDRLLQSPQGSELQQMRHRRRDGTIVPVEVTRRVLRTDEGTYIIGIGRDMTERLRGEEQLRVSHERFEMVSRATNDVVWDWNLVTDQVWWNENFQTLFGYKPHEIGAYADFWRSRIHPEDSARVRSQVDAAIRGGAKAWAGEYRFLCKDGSYVDILDRGLFMHDEGGRPVRMIGAMMDVSERKRAERHMRVHAERQAAIARFGQFALGRHNTEELYAEAALALRCEGVDATCVLEMFTAQGEFLVRAAQGEGPHAMLGMRAPLSADGVWFEILRDNAPRIAGKKYLSTRPLDQAWHAWVRTMGSAIFMPVHNDENPIAMMCVYALEERAFGTEDLRFAEAVGHVLSTALQRQRVEQRLAHLAQFDALTGLPNRTLLQDRLAQTIVQSRRKRWHAGALFVDLDRFKLINDTLGHHQGDALIRQVGERLLECIRPGDTVGRISGDEFAVVLADMARPDDAALVAQKVLDALARPFDLGGNEAYISASIGIAAFPEDGDDAESLLKNADIAMYRAKESARNCYRFFTAEMNQRTVAKVQLNTDLRRAIEREEFALHYQPKVDLSDGRLRGLEALLRWNHPERGMVSPGEFIPALEDSGLILPVGEWVIGEACAQLRRWKDEGRAVVPVAVNLSPKQFRHGDLDRIIRELLARQALGADLLELEITESCLMEDPEDAVRVMHSLRGAGLRISIDDFGTGYSSLSYLTRLPLSALKIDRSFVRDAGASAEAASIVRAVIDMAQNMRFTVIAEGVETAQQAAFLREHGCDQAQGYFFGRPDYAAVAGEQLARA